MVAKGEGGTTSSREEGDPMQCRDRASVLHRPSETATSIIPFSTFEGEMYAVKDKSVW